MQADKQDKKPPAWRHLSAPAELKGWRTDRQLNQAEAAATIGIDPAKYCALECARSRPCLDHAALIERATDGRVKAIAWAQSTARIRRTKAERSAARRAAAS